MTPEDKIEIYNKGVKSGRRHSESSPETKRFMAKIETEMIHVKEELKKQSIQIGNLPTKSDMELSNEKLIQRVFKSADGKYASKETEKTVRIITLAIVVFVLNNLLGLL
jgi:hypothetical protein